MFVAIISMALLIVVSAAFVYHQTRKDIIRVPKFVGTQFTTLGQENLSITVLNLSDKYDAQLSNEIKTALFTIRSLKEERPPISSAFP